MTTNKPPHKPTPLSVLNASTSGLTTYFPADSGFLSLCLRLGRRVYGLLTPLFNRLVIIIPYVWLLLFFLVPFLIIFKLSFSVAVEPIAGPDGLPGKPYAPVMDLADISSGAFFEKLKLFSLTNFERLFTHDLYLRAYVSSVVIAGISTALALLIGYPIAYGMARAPSSVRPMLVMIVMLPFWTSFLIRVYAWIAILKPEGLLNKLLLSIGLIDSPLIITNTHYAVLIGIVYTYLPFMILPLYATLEKMDHSLIEAASDLGCPPTKAFWQVTFPLSVPGVIAGCLLVFIPAVGEYVIPELLGGNNTLMIGKEISKEYFQNRDWPMASAVAAVLLLLLLVPIVYFQHAQARAQEQERG